MYIVFIFEFVLMYFVIFLQMVLPTNRINLNKYWSKFGEMVSPSKNRKRRQIATPVKAKRELFTDTQPVKSRYVPCEDSKEIDENLANELKEIWSNKVMEVCYKM